MVSKEKAKKIVAILSQNFSDKPALHYGTPYELLVAVMLSAQCTDERVNKVTAELYKDYDTPEKMLALSQEELEEKIFSLRAVQDQGGAHSFGLAGYPYALRRQGAR